MHDRETAQKAVPVVVFTKVEEKDVADNLCGTYINTSRISNAQPPTRKVKGGRYVEGPFEHH